MLVWSRNVLAFPQIIDIKLYTIAGATITNVQITIIVTCVAMMAALALLVYRTRLGTAMRATAQNPQVAGLMGIDINRVIAFTFAIGAALAAGYRGDPRGARSAVKAIRRVALVLQ